MSKPIDLSGHRYGRLIAIEVVGKTNGGERVWLFKCDCGQHTKGRVGDIRRGHKKSCGCLHVEKAIERGKNSTTHGLTNTPEFNAHHRMIERCYNPNHTSYQNYGARGISVCNRWKHGEDGKSGAELFILDMPSKPTSTHQLERINNDGNYEPRNCCWATVKEQANNRRSNRKITWKEETKNLKQWAEHIGMDQSALSRRIKAWGLERALTTPPMRKGLRAKLEETNG